MSTPTEPTPTEPTPTPTPSHSTADPSSAQADQQPPPEPYLDQTSGKWMVETANGDELEWDTARNAWVPVVSPVSPSPRAGRDYNGWGEQARADCRLLDLVQLTEDVLKAQQEAYSVAGVDESVRLSFSLFFLPPCFRSPPLPSAGPRSNQGRQEDFQEAQSRLIRQSQQETPSQHLRLRLFPSLLLHPRTPRLDLLQSRLDPRGRQREAQG